MCWLDRCTVSRCARLSSIRARVARARRSRDCFLLIMTLSSAGSLLLGLFQDHGFICVAHALALVGLRRAVGADFCGDLTHALLVGALDHDLGLRRRLD